MTATDVNANVATRTSPRRTAAPSGWREPPMALTQTGRPSSLALAETPLGRTISTTATDIWNDSCAIDELEYAISFGAVGATANPTIVTDVWKKEPAHWRDPVLAVAARRAPAQEGDLSWAVLQGM